jgi:type VI secretion system protein ImpM
MLGAPGAPALLHWFHAQAAWYDALEALARASLEQGFMLARFDDAPAPALAAAGPPMAMAGAAWRLGLSGEDATAAIANVALHGHSLWWTEGSPLVEASLLVCRGMPPAASFAAMLDGSWAVSGWQAPEGVG